MDFLSEDYKWLIGLVISSILIIIGCLQIPNLVFFYKIMIAIMFILLIVIVSLCIVVFHFKNREKTITGEYSNLHKYTSDLVIEYNKRLDERKEIEETLQQLVYNNQSLQNDNSILSEHLTNAINAIENYKVIPPIDLNNMPKFTSNPLFNQVSLVENSSLRIDVKSEEDLMQILEGLQHGESLTYYEDDERWAKISRFDNQEKWELSYYRRGFSVRIEDFCLKGIVSNEYFQTSLSWIQKNTSVH